jgi:hypothetical protein
MLTMSNAAMMALIVAHHTVIRTIALNAIVKVLQTISFLLEISGLHSNF